MLKCCIVYSIGIGKSSLTTFRSLHELTCTKSRKTVIFNEFQKRSVQLIQGIFSLVIRFPYLRKIRSMSCSRPEVFSLIVCYSNISYDYLTLLKWICRYSDFFFSAAHQYLLWCNLARKGASERWRDDDAVICSLMILPLCIPNG